MGEYDRATRNQGEGRTAISRNQAERALLERIVARDTAAMKELYQAYHRRLARFLMRVTPRYELAEEVINDTFFIVWQRAADFRGDSQVSTWILGIAYRRALKLLRSAGTRIAVPPDAAEPSEDPGEAFELTEWLGAALAHLPPRQRMVLELAYHAGHSCEEIATIMECPVNTVKTRMFHARRRLHGLLLQLAGSD